MQSCCGINNVALKAITKVRGAREDPRLRWGDFGKGPARRSRQGYQTGGSVKLSDAVKDEEEGA